MIDSDSEAASLATALGTKECIGPLAGIHNLQVMGPIVGTDLANETMADMLENENLQKKRGRKSRSPRRSNDSSTTSPANLLICTGRAVRGFLVGLGALAAIGRACGRFGIGSITLSIYNVQKQKSR